MQHLRQICALVVGSLLCSCLFIPFTGLVFVGLWLWVRNAFLLGHPAWAVLTEPLFQASAHSLSGLLTGLTVGFLSAHRETRTAMLASLLVIALYAYVIGPTPFLAGELNKWSVYLLFGKVVGAACLVAFAVGGAWFVAKRRRRAVRGDGDAGCGAEEALES